MKKKKYLLHKALKYKFIDCNIVKIILTEAVRMFASSKKFNKEKPK